MTTYGQNHYGQDPSGASVFYGLTFAGQHQSSITTSSSVTPQYTVDPFTATSLDYNHIVLNWTQPATAGWSDFRLLSNRYGFPVDENDGVLLLDSGGPAWPGSSFLDSNVIPGTYHHYGIYLLVTNTSTSTTKTTISPVINQTQSTWTNGVNSAFISVSGGGGTATVTNNIPPGAPYPYAIKYAASAGGGGTAGFPYNAPININFSTSYTVTAWVYSPTGTVHLGMDWEHGANVFDSANSNLITVPTNTWTQVSSTVTSPGSVSNLGSAVFFAVDGSGSGSPPAYTMYITGITIQQGTTSTVSATQAQGVWIRAGLAACLAPTNFNTTQFLINTIPTHFKELPPLEELTTDPTGNQFLNQYLSVIAWSIDYLKTALVVAQNANNPDIIPVNDLYNLAATMGFPFEPEISAGVIRRGLKNVAELVQQRGTLEGIAAYTTNLAGMALDLTVGYNMMLDDNTSNFSYPKAIGNWDATHVYQSGDIVDYKQYKYVSNVNNNLNVAPTALNTNNANWNVLYYNNDQGLVDTAPAVTAPAALGVINSYPIPSGGGRFTIYWTVTLGGTTAAGDANNFSLRALDVNGTIVSTIVAASTNTSSTGSTVQTAVAATIPATAVAIAVVAVAAGTSTATYAASISTPYILNTQTGWPSSYEPRWSGATNQYPGNALATTDITALREAVGIIDPLDTTHNHSKGLKIKNNFGSTTTLDLRSVSRTPADITAAHAQPDATQVINDGVPIPYTLPSQLWSNTVEYETGQIVQYQGLPFQALKASTNIAPSSNYAASNEWQPLGYDARIQMMASAFSSGDLSSTSTQFAMQQYVYLYDQFGLSIGQVFPRSPSQMTFDADMCATTNQSFNHTSGTVLTASGVGITTIDGVVITTIGQTVLFTAQTSGQDNGYFTVTTVGTGGVATVLTRYTTGVIPAASYPDSYVFVQAGTVNAGKTFYCTNSSTPTLGTTALTFSTTAPAGALYPTSLVFDSFAKPSDWGSNVTSHSPEVGLSSGSQFTYTATTNNFVIDAFNSGVIKPSNPNSQCLVTTNYGSASAMLGITIVTTPTTAGFVQGLACRVASATSYIRVDQGAIVTHNGGVFTTLATLTNPAQAGDRLTALFNGNTITVYVNGTVEATVTSSFNNSQTNFGYIYETQSTLSGTTQPRATVQAPRRVRRSIRATTGVIRGAFIWHLLGTVQPRATVATPRRRPARASVYFIPVTTTNRAVGHTQPRPTLVNQRTLAQHSRANYRFVHVVTTDQPITSVQPKSTIMPPRRRTSRAQVQFRAVTTTNRYVGTIQSRATLANQRPKSQRSRAVPYGAGHLGNAFHVPGTRQHQIAVFQRSLAQRHRGMVGNQFMVADTEPGTPKFGPAGTTQRSGFVAQRSLTQRHRGMVGNQLMLGDFEGTTTNRGVGSIQPRATVPTPRRVSSRARIANVTTAAGEPGSKSRGVSPSMQPLAARPVQRLLSQRGRAVINGHANWEGQDETRSGPGTIQPRATLANQRIATRRSRAVTTARYVKTQNKSGTGIVGGVVTRRTRAPHRRVRRNG